MAAITRKTDMSAGLDGPATALTAKNQAHKSYINGLLVGLVGDQYQPHPVGNTMHSGGLREITSGASKTFIEGLAVARVGDPVADGDKVGTGSSNSFVE
jgi:uncharacterized Zn-binding protein involved in type VI secretion